MAFKVTKTYLLLILIINLAFFLTGCQENIEEPSSIVINEPSTYRPTSYEIVDIKSLNLIDGFRNCLYKDILVVQEWAPFQKLHVIDLSTNEIINSFGNDKNDLNSFPRNLICSCQFIEENNTLYTIAKDSKRGLYKLNLLNKTEEGHLDYQKLNYPEDLYVEHLYITEPKNDQNSPLVGYYPDEHATITYSPQTQTTEIKKIIPKVKKQNLENLLSANIYGSETSFDSSTKNIYIGYYYFNTIDIINPELDLTKSIHIGKPRHQLPLLDGEGFISDKNIFYIGFIDQTTLPDGF